MAKIREATMRKIKNGFLVSYWRAPDAPNGRRDSECGMGEHCEEFFDDGNKAGARVEELTA